MGMVAGEATKGDGQSAILLQRRRLITGIRPPALQMQFIPGTAQCAKQLFMNYK